MYLITVPSAGVTIGFEQTGYTAGEGTIVEICAVQTTGTLERESVVTFSTSDGSATGKYMYAHILRMHPSFSLIDHGLDSV